MMHRGAGQLPEFEWLQTNCSLRQIDDLLKRHFDGRFLLVACFDSGPITISEEEQALGWRTVNGGVLTPPISNDLSFPSKQFDEWWIFEKAHDAERFPTYEYFVNYTVWTLRDPRDLETEHGEKGGFEWLRSIQSRFWSMIREYRPAAYLADGETLIVAARDNSFMESLAKI